MDMKLIGNYKYHLSVWNNKRYTIVKNGDVLERVLLMTEPGGDKNTLYWSPEMAVTPELINILSARVEEESAVVEFLGKQYIVVKDRFGIKEIIQLASPPEKPFDIHYWVCAVPSTPEVIDIIAESKIGIIKNNAIIPVGTIFQIQSGLYETRHYGIFRVLKEIDPEKLLLEWLKFHPLCKKSRFDEYGFIQDVFSKGYFEYIPTIIWELGDSDYRNMTVFPEKSNWRE